MTNYTPRDMSLRALLARTCGLLAGALFVGSIATPSALAREADWCKAACNGSTCITLGTTPGCQGECTQTPTSDRPECSCAASCTGSPTPEQPVAAVCRDKPAPKKTVEICGDGLDNTCTNKPDAGCTKPSYAGTCGNILQAMAKSEVAGHDPILLRSRAAFTEPFTDFETEGLLRLGISRTYSSADKSVRAGGFGGSLGKGWHHEWDATLTCTDPEHCRVLQGLSETMLFKRVGQEQGAGELLPETLDLYVRSDSEDFGVGDRSRLVRRLSGEFILFTMDGREQHFESDCARNYCSDTDNFCTDALQGGVFHLSRVVDIHGNSVQVTHDRPAGVLLSLTDDLGHHLELKAPGSACAYGMAQDLVYDGVTYINYEYSGRNLTRVRRAAPDRRGPVIREYEYGSRGLTRIRDEAGNPIVEFGYDDQGYANSLVDKFSKVSITYADETTTVWDGQIESASTTTDAYGVGGSYTNGAWSAAYARQGRGVRCLEDMEGRAHWFDRDGAARIVRHAVYAAGQYLCRNTAPPREDLTPLLEEWFEYGLRKQIARGEYVDLDIVTATVRRSILGGLLSSDPRQITHVFVRRSDYDQQTKAGDPAGYRCGADGAKPSGVVCREIESGYTLDADGAPVPEEHTTLFSYDQRGRLVKRIGPITTVGQVPAGAVVPVEESVYWPDSGSSSDLPRLGRLREVKRYVSASAPALVTSYDYDVFGPYQIVDPNGRVTLLPKDGLGRVVAVAMPDGRAITVRYYDENSPRMLVLPSGAARRISYDLRGRIELIEYLASDPEASNPTTPQGNPAVPVVWSESRSYDDTGNVVRLERRDAAGIVRARFSGEYGSDHQLTKALHPHLPDRALEIVYDGLGMLRSYTDEEGRKVELTPDELGRVARVRRSGFTPTGSPVGQDVGRYGYANESELLSEVVDGAGNITAYQHDDFGRLLRLDSPGSLGAAAVRYTYDAGGNVLSRSWGSTSTAYRYDGLGRLISLEATSTSGAPAVSYQFRYDEIAGALGQLTSTVEPGRTTRYEYDEVGRLRFETVVDGALEAPLVTEYRYDADGNLEALVYPTGLSIRYERDPATGHPTAVRDVGAATAFASQVTYWPGGPLRGFTYGNGRTFGQDVNLRYEPLSILSGPVQLTYSPTAAGDIGAIKSPIGEEVYGYDYADRLTSRRASNGLRAEPSALVYAGARLTQTTSQSTGLPVHAFGYDEQGNVSAVSRYDAAGANLSATVCLLHDALGRLVLVGHAAPGAGGPNRLACQSAAEVQQVIARFRYDANNRRVARQDADGTWTYFAFQAGNPIAELRVSDGAWHTSREYVWLDSQPLAQLEAGANGERSPYYFHVDHLATPRALTNASGQTVWSAQLLPYGEVLETTSTDPLTGNTVVTNLRLPGQYDERLFGSLGLQGPYCNWNRWYLPGVGRYLEPDPIAMGGGFNAPHGVDWYGYATGNPLLRTDAQGLSDTQCINKVLYRCSLGDTCARPPGPGEPCVRPHHIPFRRCVAVCRGWTNPWEWSFGLTAITQLTKFLGPTCAKASPWIGAASAGATIGTTTGCMIQCLQTDNWIPSAPYYE